MQKLFWISGACVLGLACGKASEPGTEMNATSGGRAAEHAAGHGSDDKHDDATRSDDHPSTGGRGGASAAGKGGDKPADDTHEDPDAGCVEEPPAGMKMMMKPPGQAGQGGAAGPMGMDTPKKMPCKPKAGDHGPAMPTAGNAPPPPHDSMPGHEPPPPAAGKHAPPPAAGDHAPPPPPGAGDHAPPPPHPMAGAAGH